SLRGRSVVEELDRLVMGRRRGPGRTQARCLDPGTPRSGRTTVWLQEYPGLRSHRLAWGGGLARPASSDRRGSEPSAQQKERVGRGTDIQGHLQFGARSKSRARKRPQECSEPL